MSKRTAWTFALLGTVLWCGCVERTLLIESKPAGAPVWVNEHYVGVTPLEHSFAHYGVNGIRVGPVRNERDEVQYLSRQLSYDADAPWYQTFPLDFVFEVLYPGTLRDVHRVPFVELPPAGKPTYDEADMQQLLERAEDYRSRSLQPVPDAESVD